MKLVLTAACIGALGFSSVRAQACGVSATGVASCSLTEHNERARPRWVAALNGLYTATDLRFSGELEARELRSAALAVLAYLPTPALVLQAGVGAALGGSLTLPDGTHEFSPGPIGSLGADWRVFDDGRWFFVLTSVLSVSLAWTQLEESSRVAYTAIDLRLGGQLGVDIAGVLRPYVLARAFGGPVFWSYAGEAVTGTDTHHYQLGAGLGVKLSRQLTAFAEGIPLGEQALSAGVGLAF